MRELNKSIHWEEFFIQEALELEEKMKTLDVESLNKSKLRICLEHGILDWSEYEKWCMAQLGVSSLKPSVTAEDIEKFVQYAQAVELNYSQYDFWGADLIPLALWDQQLIVLGLQYNEKLVTLAETIFILAPPEVLTSIRQKMTDQKMIEKSYDETTLDSNTEVNDALEGINFNIAAPKISFTLIQPLPSVTEQPEAVAKTPPRELSEQTVTVIQPPTEQPVIQPGSPQQPSLFANATAQETQDGVWDFIAERHQEYSFEIKKQFDAFVVLKIKNKKTQVFKMDADMSRQNVNSVIFEYNLENEGPFKRIYESQRSDSFTLEQLEMFLYDYQHVCITPLMRGEKVVGFFVGFKKSPLSQKDKNLLEELAEETAS